MFPTSFSGNSGYDVNAPTPWQPWANTAGAVAAQPVAATNEEEDRESDAHLVEVHPDDNDVIELPERPASLEFHPAIAQTRSGEGTRYWRDVLAGRPAPLDPIMAALAYRAEQAHRGEPTSPLSPHTLQRLAAAVARGAPYPLQDERITAHDVLAPVPLSIGWHPQNAHTRHAARKRGTECLETPDSAFADAYNDITTNDMDGTYAAPRKRTRYDEPLEGLPTQSTLFTTPATAAVPVVHGVTTVPVPHPRAGFKRPRGASEEEEAQ